MATKDDLTLKGLQAHVIKTIVACFCAAIVASILTSFTFYYNTKSKLESHDKDISEIKVIIKEHASAINKAGEINSVSDNQIKNLQDQMTSLQSNQKEIYQLLIEVSAGQKELIKKSN